MKAVFLVFFVFSGLIAFCSDSSPISPDVVPTDVTNSDVIGAIIKPEAAGISKNKLIRKPEIIKSTVVELSDNIVGVWESSGSITKIEVKITSDHRFILSDHSVGSPVQVLSGSWKLENSTIVYRVDTLNGVIVDNQEIRHIVRAVFSSSMSIENQFGVILGFVRK